MKKLLILALPIFIACQSATQNKELASDAPVVEKTTQPEEQQTIVEQASYTPKLQAKKWNGIKEMTDDSFKSDVLASSSITLVDFNATWCGPCRKQKPILDKLVKEYAGKINFASVDVDQCPATAEYFKISSIPTLSFYKNSKQTGSTIGLTPYEDLKTMIDKQLEGKQ